MASGSHSYKRRKDVCCKPSVITCKPKSLDDLPDEIFLKILSYVGAEDLRLIIPKVCKHWNALAKDVVLWKTLSYTFDKNSDINTIEEVLTAAPALHSLIVRKREDAARILGFLFHIRGYVRKLILEDCYLGEDSYGLLFNIVALYPDLEVLSLVECSPLTSAGCCLIQRLKKLSELNLTFCPKLSGEAVHHIADSCKQLKKLSLPPEILDEDVICVIDQLGKQLTTLAFYGCNITDVAYSYFKKCARLQELEITSCVNMTDRGLLEGIGTLHELTSLHLTEGWNLTAQALSTFLHRPSMISIVLLNLSGCMNLDDDGLKGIAERCIHLKELAVLRDCDITDAGISMAISHCNQLRVLVLRYIMSITGEGFLALIPSRLPHLRRLCLDGCRNVRDEYVEELVAAVPELEIINPYGKNVRN